MNDEDLRDLFAGLALISKAWIPTNLEEHAKNCYAIADAMIEEKYRAYPEDAPPEEVGIAAVVKRTRKKHGENS
jgi:hypothetical protein